MARKKIHLIHLPILSDNNDLPKVDIKHQTSGSNVQGYLENLWKTLKTQETSKSDSNKIIDQKMNLSKMEDLSDVSNLISSDENDSVVEEDNNEGLHVTQTSEDGDLYEMHSFRSLLENQKEDPLNSIDTEKLDSTIIPEVLSTEEEDSLTEAELQAETWKSKEDYYYSSDFAVSQSLSSARSSTEASVTHSSLALSEIKSKTMSRTRSTADDKPNGVKSFAEKFSQTEHPAPAPPSITAYSSLQFYDQIMSTASPMVNLHKNLIRRHLMVLRDIENTQYMNYMKTVVIE